RHTRSKRDWSSDVCSSDLTIIEDIHALRKDNYTPIIVHGGGPFIKKQLNRLGVESKFLDGLRVTDEQTLLQTVNTLIGEVNPKIVHQVNRKETLAIGLNGVGLNLFEIEPINEK